MSIFFFGVFNRPNNYLIENIIIVLSHNENSNYLQPKMCFRQEVLHYNFLFQLTVYARSVERVSDQS